jgi:hypothetical protein
MHAILSMTSLEYISCSRYRGSLESPKLPCRIECLAAVMNVIRLRSEGPEAFMLSNLRYAHAGTHPDVSGLKADNWILRLTRDVAQETTKTHGSSRSYVAHQHPSVSRWSPKCK